MASAELTTFICLFHNADRAESAKNALGDAGYEQGSIASVGSGRTGEDRASVQQDLLGMGVPQRDAEHLGDGIAAGGVVLKLVAPEDRTDEIEKIFHHYSAEKIDDVEQDRRDFDRDAAVAGAAVTGAAVTGAAVTNEVMTNAPTLASEGSAIPVVQEELVVGKREVDRGGVRVFRRTVEEPVSEQVQLHEEHVVVERRPVNRALTQADMAAGDQVIELTETDEVPVVSKTATVVEEVRLGIESTERTETIQDSVRHTEVDVEQIAPDRLAVDPQKKF